VIDSLSEAKAKGGEDDEAEQTEVGDKRKGKGMSQVTRRGDEVFLVLLTLRMFWSEQFEGNPLW
jgi:hypothetical protein